MLSKLFKAYDVRATYPQPLNEEAAWKIGYATAQFILGQAVPKSGLKLTLPKTLLVSRDMRPHSPSLCAELVKGMRAAGADVIDLGMCDTSFIYFAVNHLGCAGGAQTTASHNPINYNGFKISGPEARPIGAASGLQDIAALADRAPAPSSAAAKGTYEQRELWPAYREHIRRFFLPPRTGRRPLKVFVDASNGMAGKLVPEAFSGLEGLELIPLNFEITGSFVHEPNPLIAENMVPTQEGVKKHKADLGACFDGDADRCMFTDEKGQLVGCDHLTALFVEHFLKHAKPGIPGGIPRAIAGGDTVVYDLRSSKVVEETIKALGATPRRSRVGHVFMKAALRESGGVFGGELSGHFYFRDNFYADSGAITLASVLWILGQSEKPFSELIAPFRKYPQSGEINFEVTDKEAVLHKLKDQYGRGATIDTLDGVTIDGFEKQGWWFNVRASNTEPLLRLNAEATNPRKLQELLEGLKSLLGRPVSGH
jgi:phosphomannomutase